MVQPTLHTAATYILHMHILVCTIVLLSGILQKKTTQYTLMSLQSLMKSLPHLASHNVAKFEILCRVSK